MALYGIDISNYQAGIDLTKVPYDILGLRASEGARTHDAEMVRQSDMNRRGRNADEVYYHLVSTGKTPEQEAENFIRQVRDRLRPQDCVCLDWEGDGTGNGVEWARRWCQIVEGSLKKRPWIYVNSSQTTDFEGTDIAEQNPLWVAWYPTKNETGGYDDRRGTTPEIPFFRRVVGWQFTESGHLPGYEGPLDLNEFYIEPGRMIDWAGNAEQPEPEQPSPTPEVGGRIGDRWRELGGENSPLGKPTGDEMPTPQGAFRMFERGAMIWSLATDAHPNYGAIREPYGRHGFEYGHLGFPTTDELPAAREGRWQGFERGSIYWTPGTGAQAVYGAIGDSWDKQGREHGKLGYPTSDEFDGRKPGGRVQRFENGVMYFTREHGTHPVWGLMLDQYRADDFEHGRWGYPTSEERQTRDGWEQDFEGGTMRVGGQAPAPGSPSPAPARYVRPIDDPGAHPISTPYRKPGGWAAGYHTGIDIACPTGTPVHATIGGDVRMNRSWGAAYGTYVVINDDVDGSDWGYCHLSEILVRDGQRVETGQVIARSGQTGNADGAHLHLERRPRGGGYKSDRDPNLWP